MIRNGKVFQREAGPLKHEKRTKRAKRMRALPDYPRKKLYASFADYAENGRGFSYDEEHGGSTAMASFTILMLCGTGIKSAADGRRCF